jgi:phage-related protein (TIGR01555 family)
MGKITSIVRDTLTNFVSGLGTGRDKSATSFYQIPFITDADLTTMFRASWLAKKIVTIPAMDATRRWRAWQASFDEIELLEATEARLGVQGKILEAKVKARLFGGSALYISTGDGDPALPLNAATVGKDGLRFLQPLQRTDIKAGEIETNPNSEYYGKPAWYELHPQGVYNPIRIHPTRLILFIGEKLPDNLMHATTLLWGDSVLLATLEAIKQADSVAANVASLVFEAKLDVIRIPDMMASLIDPEYESRLLQRFSLAATAKGINGTLMLDKDEEYEVKNPNFTTLPELLVRFFELVSGAADIPSTRLLGQSPAGLNSTGESDLRNYYDRVSAMQELEFTPAMAILDECIIRSATGTRDPGIYYTWNPLWQISDEERAKIGKLDAEIIQIINNTGLFPQEAVAKSGVNLLTEDGILPGFSDEVDAAGGLPDYEAEAEKEYEKEVENKQLPPK